MRTEFCTLTKFHKNGSVEVFPDDQALQRGAAEQFAGEYRGRWRISADGHVMVKRGGRRPRLYRKVYVGRFTTIKTTKRDVIIQHRFPKKMSMALVREIYRVESSRVKVFINEKMEEGAWE